MTDRIAQHVLWGAIAISFIAGTLLTFQTLHMEKQSSALLKQKLRDIQSLRSFEREITQGQEAVKVLAQLGDKRPIPLNDVLRDSMAGYKPDEVKDARKEAVPGWTAKQKDIVFNDAPVGEVMKFVRIAESNRPPWRLTKCAIRSSSHASGTARVELTLESVEKNR